MGFKYLRIEVEGKGLMVDLDYVKPEDIKLKLGQVNQDKTQFTSEKEISLHDLNNGGFK